MFGPPSDIASLDDSQSRALWVPKQETPWRWWLAATHATSNNRKHQNRVTSQPNSPSIRMTLAQPSLCSKAAPCQRFKATVSSTDRTYFWCWFGLKRLSVLCFVSKASGFILSRCLVRETLLNSRDEAEMCPHWAKTQFKTSFFGILITSHTIFCSVPTP